MQTSDWIGFSFVSIHETRQNPEQSIALQLNGLLLLFTTSFPKIVQNDVLVLEVQADEEVPVYVLFNEL